MFFGPEAQKAIQKKAVVPACHEIRPEILVRCMLKVLSLDPVTKTFKATVGVRELDDTTLSIGSKLLVKGKHLGEADKKAYFCKVEDVEVRQGKTVHIIRILENRDLAYQRRHARFDAELEVCRNDNLRFKTANISQGGMQLLCQNKLTSALIDQPTAIRVVIDGREIPFECRPSYIVYSWWDQCHQVGLAFINVTPVQEAILKDLLGTLGAKETDWVGEAAPKENATPAAVAGDAQHKASKTRIDPDSGRIIVEK